MQRRQVHRLGRFATAAESIGRVLLQLPLPFGDLIGCTSKRLVSSAKVLSSRKAANATWALNAAVCVRRVRRADFFTIENSFSPDLRRPGFMPGVSAYSSVQIGGATSMAQSLASRLLGKVAPR